MREPLAFPNEARDAARTKDAWGKNCFGEKGEDRELRAILRPGQQIAFDVTNGVGQGVFNYGDDAFWLVDDVLYSSPMPSFGFWISGGPTGTGYSSGSSVFYQGILYTSPTNNNMSTPPSGWTEVPPTSYLLDFLPTVVAVPQASSSLAYSTDHGVTWALTIVTSSANWNTIAWNDSTFCVTAGGSGVSSDKAMTSADGVAWTERTLPSSARWRGLAWNGTVFCAVANGTTAATSPDGVTWTPRTLPASRNWVTLAWNGSVFCATEDTGAETATSADGIAWQLNTPAAFLGQPITVLLAYGTSFIGMSSGNSWLSTDGITWGRHSLLAFQVDTWAGIAWNGTIFVTVGSSNGRSLTSSDGITWSFTTNLTGVNYSSICWDGTNFIVAPRGTPAGTTNAVTSPDGITWTTHAIGLNKAFTAIGFST